MVFFSVFLPKQKTIPACSTEMSVRCRPILTDYSKKTIHHNTISIYFYARTIDFYIFLKNIFVR
jgi:hypothetical protein